MTGFSGCQGLPSRSTEARLYKMRRFMGQLQAHPGYRPMPEGSSLFLRAAMLPSWV